MIYHRLTDPPGLIRVMPTTRHRSPRRQQGGPRSQRNRKGIPAQGARRLRGISLHLRWIRARSVGGAARGQVRDCAAADASHGEGNGAGGGVGGEAVVARWEDPDLGRAVECIRSGGGVWEGDLGWGRDARGLHCTDWGVAGERC